MTRGSKSGVGIRACGVIGLGLLLALPASPAVAADGIGVPCARAKLRAIDKATRSLIKCYARAKTFGTVDPACVERVRSRLERDVAVAERLGCYGFQDAAAQMWTLIGGYVSDVMRSIAPPDGCHVENDGLTCGGLCAPGFTCSALGEQCICLTDALVCNATSFGPVLCPKIGQHCVDRTCVDPDDGYCREEPAGSGQAIGFCPSDRTCLALPMGGGTAVSCLPRIYACEDPAGFCATTGAAFGFCTDVAKTCGSDCLCH